MHTAPTPEEIEQEKALWSSVLKKNIKRYPTLHSVDGEERKRIWKLRKSMLNGSTLYLGTAHRVATASGVTLPELFARNHDELQGDIQCLVQKHNVSIHTPSMMFPGVVSKKELGTRLLRRRYAKKLKQEYIAYRLNITNPNVTFWESGRNMPSAVYAHLLAREIFKETLLELVTPNDELPGVIAFLAQKYNIPLVD